MTFAIITAANGTHRNVVKAAMLHGFVWRPFGALLVILVDGHVLAQVIHWSRIEEARVDRAGVLPLLAALWLDHAVCGITESLRATRQLPILSRTLHVAACAVAVVATARVAPFGEQATAAKVDRAQLELLVGFTVYHDALGIFILTARTLQTRLVLEVT